MADISLLKAGWSMLRSIVTTPAPRPVGGAAFDHAALGPILSALADEGIRILPETAGDLDDYLAALGEVDPNRLSTTQALAFWINLYNAAALRLVGAAQRAGEDSVLRIPGGFDRSSVTVRGRPYSLDSIEHAKVRRFKDPRIHAALVCGSASCPILRREPYQGDILNTQLDDQLRRFLRAGAAARNDAGELSLSLVFAWYGGDFVRPHRMPVLVPASRGAIRDALTPWLTADLSDWVRAARPTVVFMGYDWSLRCVVG